MFKSPHTGNLGESHAGGRSALSIRMAGYGAVIIKGKSERPCYISIYSDKVFSGMLQLSGDLMKGYQQQD